MLLFLGLGLLSIDRFLDIQIKFFFKLLCEKITYLSFSLGVLSLADFVEVYITHALELRSPNQVDSLIEHGLLPISKRDAVFV